MDVYINYVLTLLSAGSMNENSLRKNLSQKFSLTDSYCGEIIAKMIDENLIESEFDEDFQNIYSITQSGDTLLNNQEDEYLEIDYKSLLGDMCENNDCDDIINSQITENNEENAVEFEEENLIEETIYESDNNQLKDFSNFKINVRKFNNSYKFETKSNAYLKSIKLEFFTSLVLFFIFLGITSISYFYFYSNGFLDTLLSQKYDFFLLLFCIYPIVCLFLYIFNSNKKEKNTFKFKQSFKLILLTVSIVLIIVLALNFLFGLEISKWLKFLPYWLFPIILGIIAILYPLVKQMLIKSNKFNA